MSAAEDTLVSIGCDYLTVTAPESRGMNTLHSYASDLFRTQADFGFQSKPWGMAGFKGWKCGSVEIGVRDSDVMVRLHSDSAFRNWRRCVELCSNVSRLDLQATIQVTDGPTERIDEHRAQARLHSKENYDKPIVRWTADHKGGYTLYLGARSSICFGRIYDKYQHTKLDHYRDCVRFEVQYHNKLASRLAMDLAAESSPIPRIGSHLTRFFRARRVPLNLPGDNRATIRCPRNKTDDDRQLEWLQTQVRPSVLRLISRDRGEDVFRALGLIDDNS